MPGPRQSLHELACEPGGLRHETDVTARQLDHVTTQLLTQFHADLIGWTTMRFLPGHQHDPFGMGCQRPQIEVDRRILSQLMLEPIGGVGLVLGGTGHGLPV
jgi:hypothetical protein